MMLKRWLGSPRSGKRFRIWAGALTAMCSSSIAGVLVIPRAIIKMQRVGLAPDVILATGTPTVGPLLQATHNVPIVFVQLADPVGAGMVESLSRPGGNATGFTTTDYEMAGKWLGLLKEIARLHRRGAAESSLSLLHLLKSPFAQVSFWHFPAVAADASES
jgi:hypothetical protein